MDRQLADAARPGDGLFAARVVVAEQHVGERMAAFDAGKKRVHQRAGFLDQRRDGERAAGDEHHDHGFAGGDQRVDERLLAAGQIEICAILRFAALRFAFADDRDDEVAVARSAGRFGDALRIAFDRLAFAVDLRAFAE